MEGSAWHGRLGRGRVDHAWIAWISSRVLRGRLRELCLHLLVSRKLTGLRFAAAAAVRLVLKCGVSYTMPCPPSGIQFMSVL